MSISTKNSMRASHFRSASTPALNKIDNELQLGREGASFDTPEWGFTLRESNINIYISNFDGPFNVKINWTSVPQENVIQKNTLSIEKSNSNNSVYYITNTMEFINSVGQKIYTIRLEKTVKFMFREFFIFDNKIIRS